MGLSAGTIAILASVMFVYGLILVIVTFTKSRSQAAPLDEAATAIRNRKDEQIKKISHEFLNARKEVEALQERIDELRVKLQRSEKEAVKKDRWIARLQKLVQVNERRKEQLRTIIANKETAILKAQKKVDKDTFSVKVSPEEVAARKSGPDKAETIEKEFDLLNLRQKIEEASTELSKAKEDLARSQQEAEESKRQTVEMRVELATTKEYLDSLQQKLREAQAQPQETDLELDKKD